MPQTVNTSTPTVRGTVTNPNGVVSGLTVSVYVDGVFDGTTTTASDGSWSYTVQAPVQGIASAPQNHVFRAEVVLPTVSDNLTVTVAAPSVAPTDLSIDLDWVVSGSAPGTPVARLSTVDANVGEAHTYTLVDDAGGRFAVSGDILVVGAAGVSFASASVLANGYSRGHDIIVRVSDADSHTLVKTFTIRVLQSFSEYLVEPAAIDPSTLPGLLADINPTAANVTKDGSNLVSALVSGSLTFTQSTAGSKPTWTADGGNGKPCLTMTATKFLQSADAGLVNAFDGINPLLSVVVIGQTDGTGGAQRIFTIGQSAAENARFQSYYQSGLFGFGINDYPNHTVNNGQTAVSQNGSITATPTCGIGMVTSRESMMAERDFVAASRYMAAPRPLYLSSAASSTQARIGSNVAGVSGKIYRVLVFTRPLTSRERFGICKWANANYGTPLPSWSVDIDPSSGYTLDYAEEFEYANLSAVNWTDSRVESRNGLLCYNGGSQFTTIPVSGPFANRVVGGRGANESEDVLYLNVTDETPELRQYDTLEFRSSFALLKQRNTPLAIQSIVQVNGVQKAHISAQMYARYDPSIHRIYGVWEFEGVMPRGAGAGIWPAVWLFGSQQGSQCELDLQEMFGQDTWTDRATVHDATIPGAANGSIAVLDDQSDMATRWTVEVTPTTTNFYVNRRLIKTIATSAQIHSPKYWLVNNTNGGPTNPFPGPPDSTTTYPNVFAVNFVRHYYPNETITALAGTQTEATALFDAWSSAATPASAGRQTAVNTLIAKAKGSTGLCEDGTTRSIWDCMDFLFIPAAHSETAGLYNWKAPSIVATKTGAPAFTTDRGVKGATGAYWDTGINLTTASGYLMTPNNMHMAVFTLDECTGTGDMFAAGSPAWGVFMSPTDQYFRVGSTTSNRVYKGAKDPGLFGISRLTTNAIVPWWNGKVSGFLSSGPSSGSTFDNLNLLIGGVSATNPGAMRVASFSGGRYMTESHWRRWNTILREYLTTLGAI